MRTRQQQPDNHEPGGPPSTPVRTDSPVAKLISTIAMPANLPALTTEEHRWMSGAVQIDWTRCRLCGKADRGEANFVCGHAVYCDACHPKAMRRAKDPFEAATLPQLHCPICTTIGKSPGDIARDARAKDPLQRGDSSRTRLR
mmetsp:Transcript_3280/g.11003  ORF Transcript_3280/g.11003 Transcript_3280/m.11003 type:complete len:143 (-) Transcript_3280:313-741(-)